MGLKIPSLYHGLVFLVTSPTQEPTKGHLIRVQDAPSALTPEDLTRVLAPCQEAGQKPIDISYSLTPYILNYYLRV